jgi:hypothetical protein
MASGQSPVSPGRLEIQRVPVQGLQFTTVNQLDPVTTDQNLPLDSTQNGNIFNDRFNSQITWYLPGYQLAADIDTTFSFAATEQSIDSSGNPSYQATIKLTLAKVEPPDVTTYRVTYPTAHLQEIPLTGLAVTLTITANDPQTGQPQQSVYTAAVTADDSGNLLLTFNTLLGAQVLVAYYDLQSGGATLNLSAQFEVWRVLRIFRPIDPPVRVGGNPIGGRPVLHPQATIVGESPVLETSQLPTEFPFPQPFPRPVPVTTYVTASDPFTLSFPLAQKYTAPGYATSFTVSDSNGVRPILTINDLKSFNVNQTEFTEFTALGNVSGQFPSFSRLYIGRVSRTIVAVPAVYGILRSKNGTAAQCDAQLDSTAGGSSAAQFNFAFVLGPVMSPFDLFALQTALASNPQSQNFTLVWPQRLDSSQPMTLATPFQSSAQYTAGTQAQTFDLTVDIADGGVVGSAVANANLLLDQLSATVEPFLSGSFGIVLDDAYPHPVMVNVVVNFSQTSGTSDISYSIAADGSSIELVNASPLDLAVSRYAIVSGTTAPPENLNQTIPAQQSLALSDKVASPAVQLLVDRALALSNPLSKADLQKYIPINVVDVENVNFQLAIVANGVNFTAMGIQEIDVVITIPSMPNIVPPPSTLTALSLASNAVITLPIQNAITSLPAVIEFTAKAVGGGGTVNFTQNNDFVNQPVYVLDPSNIPPFGGDASLL